MKNKTYNSSRCFCWQGQKSNKDFTDKKIISKNFLVFVLASLICLVGVVYVFQINKMATMGYEMKEREAQIRQLQEKGEQLEIKAAQLRSIYISQIQEAQEEKERVVKEENQNQQDESQEERDAGMKSPESFLMTMRKPEQASFLEVEVERIIAMK